MAASTVVLHFAMTSPPKVRALARAFAHGLGLQNVAVEVLDGDSQLISGMARYSCITIIVETNVWGKMPVKLDTFFQRAGMLNGIRCYVYVARQLIGGRYALNDLVTLMEKHGMKVRNFGLLPSEKAAEQAGASCRIEHDR